MRRSHGRERCADPEPPQCRERLDEGLLGGILGFGRAPTHDMGDANGEVLVPPNQLFVGADIAAPRPFDELLLLQWPVLHGVLSAGTPREPGRFRGVREG